MSAVMAFLPCDALAAAAKVNREWAEATATPPATAHWRELTISEFGLAVSNAETDKEKIFKNYVLAAFGLSTDDDDATPFREQRRRLLAPIITDSPPRLDLDWRRLYFDIRHRKRRVSLDALEWLEGLADPERDKEIDEMFESKDEEPEDTRRGHELRCTYGLAAVAAEQKRLKERRRRNFQRHPIPMDNLEFMMEVTGLGPECFPDLEPEGYL